MTPEEFKRRVDEFLKDIDNYETDCNITASERCKACNDTMFQAIRDFVDNNFGKG